MAFIGPYKLGATLGRGQFGTVNVAEHTATGQRYAVKVVSKQRADEAALQKLAQEITNHRGLVHPNVIRLYDVLETEKEVFLVMEYAPGGDVFELMMRRSRLLEDEARRLFRQIVAAVGHCHGNMIVHRDVKPENLILDANGNVKLADFGLSGTMVPGELLTDSVGSANYAAPELFTKGCSYEGPELDVWSCGIVLYVLLCGGLPFDADDVTQLVWLIRRGRYVQPGYLSSEAKDLLSQMIEVDPTKRITLAGVLAHDWLRKEPARVPPASARARAHAPAPQAAAPAAPAGVCQDPDSHVAQQSTALLARAKTSSAPLAPLLAAAAAGDGRGCPRGHRQCSSSMVLARAGRPAKSGARRERRCARQRQQPAGPPAAAPSK